QSFGPTSPRGAVVKNDTKYRGNALSGSVARALMKVPSQTFANAFGLVTSMGFARPGPVMVSFTVGVFAATTMPQATTNPRLRPLVMFPSEALEEGYAFARDEDEFLPTRGWASNRNV